MTRKNLRRQSVLEKLKEQLSNNVKPLKVNGKTTGDSVELSEKDKTRISAEIDILTRKLKI